MFLLGEASKWTVVELHYKHEADEVLNPSEQHVQLGHV